MGRGLRHVREFKGIVDEFRLYKTALAQDSIRGLLWFLKGANSLVIPRGVFYGSKMYKQLNDSATNFSNANSPLTDAKVYGNSNTLSSNLNSRVTQMVIAKNVTLAQAWGILDLARTNSTGNVTAFPFFATAEFYTLGFADEANSLVANTSVVNGGNTSVAPPPTSWQLFWNTIAGLASGPWNPWIAVGAFFYNLGKWLVQAFVAYVKGLTTGNWTDFQQKVLEPLAKAFDAAVRALFEFISRALHYLMDPILDPIVRAASEAVAIINSLMSNGVIVRSASSTSPVVAVQATAQLSGPFARLGGYFAIIMAAISAIILAVTILTGGAGALLSNEIVKAIFNGIKGQVVRILAGAVGTLGVVVAVAAYKQFVPQDNQQVQDTVGFVISLIGILVIVFSAAVSTFVIEGGFLDVYGLAAAVIGLLLTATVPGVLGVALGLAFAVFGLLWTVIKVDWFDKIPIAGMLEEFISGVSTGWSLSVLFDRLDG